MRKYKQDLIMGVVFLFLSLFLIIATDHFISGGIATGIKSSFFPRLSMGIIAVVSVALILSSVHKMRNITPENAGIKTGVPSEKVSDRNMILFAAILVAYIVSLYLIGFLLATPILIDTLMFLLGGRRFVLISLLSIITPIVFYYVCLHFMKLILPVGILMK